MKKPAMILIKNSSNIHSVGYRDGDLYVEFHDGAVYRHAAVPHDLFQAIQNADSAGKFYHGRIKGKFSSEKVVFDKEGDAPAPITDDAGNPHPATQEAQDKARADELMKAAIARAEQEFVDSGMSAFFVDRFGMKEFKAVPAADSADVSENRFVYVLYNQAGEAIITGTLAQLNESIHNEKESVNGASSGPQTDTQGVPGSSTTATVSINGGPKVDVLSEEGQAMIRDAVAKAKEAGEVPLVSFNDGPEYPLGSPEADAELAKLQAAA